MDYLKYISTEHTVYSEANPKKTIMSIARGTIVGGWIYFPSGPAGLLNCIVRKAKFQIFPNEQGQTYRLDNCMAPLFGNVEILQPPYQLTIETWNLSTTYNHALTICIFIDHAARIQEKQSFLSKFLGKNDRNSGL